MRGQRGFTLIEALLALAIFAVIGIAAYRLLDSTARLEEGGEKRYRAVGEMQTTMRLLEDDFIQIAPAGSHRTGAEEAPALDGAPDEGLVEFTRSGWRNPLGAPRSHLQRVLWDLDGEGRLLRRAWPGRDKGTANSALTRVTAQAVESLEIRYLDDKGAWQDTWPPRTARARQPAAQNPAEPLPVAVEFRLVQQQLGEVIRVVPLR